MTNLDQIYAYVKQEDSELYTECIQTATAVAHNHYHAAGVHDELNLMASIEAALMKIVFKVLK